MKIRFFETFCTNLDYVAFNLFPVISFESFKHGDKCIFIGWLIWGFQIKW